MQTRAAAFFRNGLWLSLTLEALRLSICIWFLNQSIIRKILTSKSGPPSPEHIQHIAPLTHTLPHHGPQTVTSPHQPPLFLLLGVENLITPPPLVSFLLIEISLNLYLFHIYPKVESDTWLILNKTTHIKDTFLLQKNDCTSWCIQTFSSKSKDNFLDHHLLTINHIRHWGKHLTGNTTD